MVDLKEKEKAACDELDLPVLRQEVEKDVEELLHHVKGQNQQSFLQLTKDVNCNKKSCGVRFPSPNTGKIQTETQFNRVDPTPKRNEAGIFGT